MDMPPTARIPVAAGAVGLVLTVINLEDDGRAV
jgi:hypothetical protein